MFLEAHFGQVSRPKAFSSKAQDGKPEAKSETTGNAEDVKDADVDEDEDDDLLVMDVQVDTVKARIDLISMVSIFPSNRDFR